MSPFLRIPLGLLVMVIGFLMVRSTDKVLEWFGRLDYMEEHLGPGGSRLFYKLLGILIVFIGIFISTNIISDMLTSFAQIFVR